MLRTEIAIAIGLVCFVGEAMAGEVYRAKTPEAFIGRVVENGHCVKFVQAAAGAPRTSGWRPGRLVYGDSKIAPGTAIATFETDGSYTSATGEKGWFGWPSNELHEKLRDKWAAAATLDEQKAVAREIQKNAWDFVPHIWFGQWLSPVAYRTSLKGVLKIPEIIPFWNIEKSA